jgi:cysteine-rich repeat protein
MHTRSQLGALCVAAALTACSTAPATPTPGDGQLAEDCTTAGDEDGNGQADCSDPACVSAPACQPACGNGRVDPGEVCDDGNTASGDSCSPDCRSDERCGNGIVDPEEECEPGSPTSQQGCDCPRPRDRCSNERVRRRDSGKALIVTNYAMLKRMT